jgi:hypothetical protein
MRRLVIQVLVVLCLPVFAICQAAENPTSHQDLGVRFDPGQLLAQGWRQSQDPADFPLRIEDKSENFLLGLIAPDGRARIFILYSLPAKPIAMDSIETDPPQALLARLGVRRPEASGRFEEGFLSKPSLSAVHWALIGPGDGITFSVEAEAGQQTFSLRTILSLVVDGPGADRRPLLLTSFLRCRPAEAERLRPQFFALLRTLAPAEKALRLMGPEVAVQEELRKNEAQALGAASALLERVLPSLSPGKTPELSAEDRSALDAVLRLLPADPVAALLLEPPSGDAAPVSTDAELKQALRSYLEHALRFAQTIEETQWLRRRYQTEILALSPANK